MEKKFARDLKLWVVFYVCIKRGDELKLLGLVLIIGIFIATLKFVIGSFERPAKSGPINAFAYGKSKKLFTHAERSFLGVLEQAAGVEYRVFCKIRIREVLQPKLNLPNRNFDAALNKVNKKHLDFIICRKNDSEILGVIELDDSRHEKKGRRSRDSFVDKALEGSGIPVLRISAQRSYTAQEIRTLLVDGFALNLNESMQKGAENSETNGLRETIAQPICEESTLVALRKADTGAQGVAEESCPECGSIMRTGKVSRGPHQGKYFFVCTNYPSCKTLKRVNEQVA